MSGPLTFNLYHQGTLILKTNLMRLGTFWGAFWREQ